MFRYTVSTESYESIRSQVRKLQTLINRMCFATPDLQNHMIRWGIKQSMLQALSAKQVAKNRGSGVDIVHFVYHEVPKNEP